ncbi:PREDICTED: probable E3 ubiquitin-protein ligase DTX2 [Cyprinodon variegatus]|uniref:probable E3 ubiquitin-protein ligase DTX2 n=1 Tax=Cyprinodon variegatus TaxID=28743 RepID=UPI00074258BA|nr:PREDICTED: probable E3 ubiquitin-protein ligase DTX2 [Cyprinodon variegatus]
MAIVSGSCARVNGSRNGPSVSATTAPGSVGQSQPMIAVWEWQDDLGYWRPYSGQVSAYIERCLSARGHRGAGATSICLGQSDPSLSPYLIDIPSLKQFRQDTGKTRSVRRSLFAQSSGLGSGVYWEWANDEGSWTPYETRTSILLEHSYQARQGTADLGPHGYNYIVDLTSLAQVNKSTGFRRQVRRQCNLPYPLATSGPPAIPSAPACSCQQCLSHSSTGPMPSRSRHSFSSNSLTRPTLQGTGRVAAAHPTSVYSPYPRRPLSVGGVSWGSPWPPPPSAGRMQTPHLSGSSSANGLSVPSISVQLNGSTSVSSALAGMASILMSAVGLGVHFTSAPLPQQQQQQQHHHHHQQPAPFALPPPPPLLPTASRPPSSSSSSSSVRRAKRQHRRASAQRSEDVIQRYMEVVAEVPEEGPEHPNPGQPFTCRGFPRFCFLPDNDKGRKVLELLKVAWMRRLIFTVGTSSTTGEHDTVVWNGIHHKTEMMSNLSGHGYPDPNYLDNVLSELASQGVTEDCLKPPAGSG